MTPLRSELIKDAACEAARCGIAVVSLAPRSKKPVEGGWTKLPAPDEKTIRAKWRRDGNFGIRLGGLSEPKPGRFVHGIDLDIQNISDPSLALKAKTEALNALRRAFPGVDAFPSVRSGSGGESRHFYVLCKSVTRKLNIARASWKADVIGPNGAASSKLAWEIDWYGDGVQLVLPPSVHPSGKRYEWVGRVPDWSTDLPLVDPPSPRVEVAPGGPQERRQDAEPLASLEHILFETEAYDNSDPGLPYDEWLSVIFAVKTEYAGTDLLGEARELVEEWSRQSVKFDVGGKARFDEVWRHADPNRVSGITLGTLKAKVRDEENVVVRKVIEDEMADERSAEDIAVPEKARKRDWYGRLLRNGDGRVITSRENIRAILANDEFLQEVLLFDTTSRQVMWCFDRTLTPEKLPLVKFEGGKNIRPFSTQTDYIIISDYLFFSYGMEKTIKYEINDSVLFTAQARPVNLLLEHFTSVAWDGVLRRESLLTDYLGAEDTNYTRSVCRMFVDAIMARIVKPGTKFDHMVILEGEQGIGKDRFLKLLVGEDYYTDSLTDLSDPAKYVYHTRHRAIVHLSELASMRRHEVEVLKSFITKTEDTARLAYAADAVTLRRSWVVVGSTNESEYLQDATGDRRYMPVECGKPDFDPETGIPTAYRRKFAELVAVRAQIWAEAYHFFLKSRSAEDEAFSIELSPSAIPQARALQQRKRADPDFADYATRLGAVIDLAAPMVDLTDKCPPGFEKRNGLRNVISAREAMDLIGEPPTPPRDYRLHLMRKALNALSGWQASEKKVKYHTISQTVWVRIGATSRAPTPLDDNAHPHLRLVMSDERPKARRREIVW